MCRYDLVGRLRFTPDYIPGLSLVAEQGGVIVGHVMMSRIYTGAAQAVALAPLAVHAGYRKSGIGKCLVGEAHRRSGSLGYVTASLFGIKPPFDVPDEFFMACRLAGTGEMPSGVVRYSTAFGIV